MDDLQDLKTGFMVFLGLVAMGSVVLSFVLSFLSYDFRFEPEKQTRYETWGCISWFCMIVLVLFFFALVDAVP